MFGLQQHSLHTARGLVRTLPASCVWSLVITDDCDDEGSCGVLNIFVQTEEQRVRTRKQLNLTGPPVEEGDDYETYKVDGLSVSIVEM